MNKYKITAVHLQKNHGETETPAYELIHCHWLTSLFKNRNSLHLSGIHRLFLISSPGLESKTQLWLCRQSFKTFRYFGFRSLRRITDANWFPAYPHELYSHFCLRTEFWAVAPLQSACQRFMIDCHKSHMEGQGTECSFQVILMPLSILG